MIGVHILAEGQTEESFVKELLAPHLARLEVFVTVSLVTTKFNKGGARPYKGGVVPYRRIKRELGRFLRQPTFDVVTTMLDLSGLPPDFPGKSNIPSQAAYQRVQHLESAFEQDVQHSKFLPYLALHEFEALLFADTHKIAEAFAQSRILKPLNRIKASFKSPEEINDDEPPSQRLETLVGAYDKPLYGLLIAREIGLDHIRAECPHFNQWIKQLEKLGKDK